MTLSPDESDPAREGSSDATPGGLPDFRRPGELAFAAFLLIASLILLWSAYGIAGFRALSSPGAIPMATTAVMALTTGLVLWRTWRQPTTGDETLRIAVFPNAVILIALMLVAYGVLLRPLGFLPTSAVFLFLAIKVLAGRSILFTTLVTLGSLAVIWLIFRIVFVVLMPPGIVPEAQILEFLRNAFSGGA